MSKLYGFAGKTLRVDLGTGDISSKPLDRGLVERFIGGMGISSWLAYSLIERETDPLSGSNVLVFSVSPLAGTIAPSASRVHVTGRSPDSQFVCYGNAGHSAGMMMKYAGYDNLIIMGRAEKPAYLRITDDVVEIHDASHLWGKNTRETTHLLQKELPSYWVDCVGPSAENLVKYSTILCSMRSSFNKTGPGTIMASKNLKAIAAWGTRGVKVADPVRFKQLTDAMTRQIVSDPELETYRTFGGSLRDRPGFTRETFSERIVERPYACPSCPVACKHLVRLRGGNYEGLRYRISHLAALVGHNWLGGPEDWYELAKVVELENLEGIEASVIASMLNYLVECHEHGILTEKEIGFKPKRGGRALRSLIRFTVDRRGIGSLTADGLLAAIKHVGDNSEKYAQHSKSIGREHHLESQVSISTIGSLTNPRGGKAEFAHVPYGNTNTTKLEPRRFCADLGLQGGAVNRVCDGPDGFNVGRLLKWAEDYTAVSTSMGFCNRPILIRHTKLKMLSELYEAATGIASNPSQLLEAGERVFNVLKAFNVKTGATRRDDLPSRGATWPPDKPLVIAGKKYGTLNQILDQYHHERGWDMKSGIPTKHKLKDLGLKSVADDLGI